MIAAPSVTAVVVTHERPELLRRCLTGIDVQTRKPDRVIVLDNASGQATRSVIDEFAFVTHIRLTRNMGGAFGFHAAIAAALKGGPDFVWTMDDDGVAADQWCLERLLRVAVRLTADIVGPLVVDVDDPERLAFPLRLRGRTLRMVQEVPIDASVPGFAHLFNGTLVRAVTFDTAGLPNPTLVTRGDEVEFLLRARRHGASVVLTPSARFRHPSSRAELKPMLFGRYHAVMPSDQLKRRYTFRNRGYIFAHHGLWLHLGADAARYTWFFLVTCRGDIAGLVEWLALTHAGLRLRHAVDLPIFE